MSNTDLRPLLFPFQRQSELSQKEAAIAAARVYCNLVLVPGSAAFRVFHPDLFEKSVDLLKLFNITSKYRPLFKSV